MPFAPSPRLAQQAQALPPHPPRPPRPLPLSRPTPSLEDTTRISDDRAPRMLQAHELPVVIYTHSKWPGISDIVNGRAMNKVGEPTFPCRASRLDDALDASHPNEFYLVQYQIAKIPNPTSHVELQEYKENGAQPYRLTLTAPADLVTAGWIEDLSQVACWGIALDIDLKDYKDEFDPWADDMSPAERDRTKVPWSQEWRDNWTNVIWPRACEAMPLLEYPTAAYTTKHGMRLIYAFDRPLPMLGIGNGLDRIRGFMTEAYIAGLKVDKATADWTRLQGLPRIVKESASGQVNTGELESFRFTWGRVDLSTTDVLRPELFVAYDPYSLRPATTFPIVDYIDHPLWDTLRRFIIDPGKHAEEALGSMPSLHITFGSMPDDDRVTQLLHGTKGASGRSQRHAKVRDIVDKIARRQGDNPIISSAAASFEILWEGKRLDLCPDGTSNLHAGALNLIKDVLYLLRTELGMNAGQVGPDLIYSLIIPKMREANDARASGDGGRRSDAELCTECWRLVTDLFATRLAKEAERKREDEAEVLARQVEIVDRTRQNAIAQRAIKAWLKEATGADDAWIDDNWDHHLVVITKLGFSVVGVRDGVVTMSDPVDNWTKCTPMLREAGHSLIQYRTISIDKNGTMFTDYLKEVEVLDKHAISCGDRVRASRLIPDSTLKKTTVGSVESLEFVWKRPGMRQDIEAKYDPICEEFLHLLGGDMESKLLDWCASYFDIQGPLPALYIHGPPGCGKGLLLAALQMGTERGKGAEFGDALQDFQDDFLDTPLVQVDEDTGQKGAFQKDTVSVLRRMVGGEFSAIRQKGIKNLHIDGHWRIVICANNANVFDIKRDLDEHDVQAMNGRILYVDVTNGDRAQRILEYFDRLGGRYGNEHGEGTAKMNLPGRLIKHIRHLADTRTVVKGNRFLIDAPLTEWHQQFRTNTPGTLEVCKAINALISEMRLRGGAPVTGSGLVVERGNTQHSMGRKKEITGVFLFASQFEDYLRRSSGKVTFNLANSIKAVAKAARPRLSNPADRATYGEQPRGWQVDVGAVLRALTRLGYDTDWRDVLGPDIWNTQAPEEVQADYKDRPMDPHKEQSTNPFPKVVPGPGHTFANRNAAT